MTMDALAKGAVKHQFPPAGQNVTQERWDAIFKAAPKSQIHKSPRKGRLGEIHARNTR